MASALAGPRAHFRGWGTAFSWENQAGSERRELGTPFLFPGVKPQNLTEAQRLPPPRGNPLTCRDLTTAGRPLTASAPPVRGDDDPFVLIRRLFGRLTKK